MAKEQIRSEDAAQKGTVGCKSLVVLQNLALEDEALCMGRKVTLRGEQLLQFEHGFLR